MKHLIILFALFQIHIATAQKKDQPSASQLSPAGSTSREFTDQSRSNWLGNGPRPIRTMIWYPAMPGGKIETINDPAQFSSPVNFTPDGMLPANAGRYPLIVISHGSQGNAQQMRWLGYHLASRGYIAVAINHNGTPEEEKQIGALTLSDFCIWERPKDVSVVIDRMLTDKFFINRIDTSKIAVAGFSLGGATAIWTSGATLDLERLRKNMPPPPPNLVDDINRMIALSKEDPVVQQSIKRAGDSYRDPRIKAVFALAPAIAPGFPKESLQKIDVPVFIVAGDADVITPHTIHAKYYAENIPGAKITLMPGELGHYTKPPVGTERPGELQEVSDMAFRFFTAAFGAK